MANNPDFEAIVATIMGDLDVPDALAVLKERGLPAEYTDEAAQQLHDEANKLAEEGAAIKAEGGSADARKAKRAEVARVLNARALLYRLRAARPGDVAAGVPPVGGQAE